MHDNNPTPRALNVYSDPLFISPIPRPRQRYLVNPNGLFLGLAFLPYNVKKRSQHVRRCRSSHLICRKSLQEDEEFGCRRPQRTFHFLTRCPWPNGSRLGFIIFCPAPLISYHKENYQTRGLNGEFVLLYDRTPLVIN